MLIDRGTGQWEIASNLASETGANACALLEDLQHGCDSQFDQAREGAEARFAVVVQATNQVPLTLVDVAVAPLGVGWTSMH